MARKTYIVDTTILLQDPDCMQKFTDNNVVVSMFSLEELDRMKRYTDELGKNARQVLRYIDSLKSEELYSGIDIGNGVRFRVFVEKKNGAKNGFPFPVEGAGNRILHTAYLVKEMGEDVVLITRDSLLRIRAESIGIQAEDYRNLKDSYESIYQGIRRIKVEKKHIEQFYTGQPLDLDLTDCYPNEYCILMGEEKEIATKYNKKKKTLEPLLAIHDDIWGIQPINIEQRCAVDLLLRDDIKLVSFIGQAGTGKTLLALACGLKKVFDEDVYSRILISRPIMPLGKDIGFLPGTKEEKLYHWMQPIYDNLEFLCESTCGSGNGSETKDFIMESDKIEMEAVTYIRGRTLPKMFIIIDEAQNLTPHEMKTIISRAGQGTKVILAGDPSQIDNPYLDKDSNALTYIVGKFKHHAIFGHMMFRKTERSELAALAADIL
ncbi:MAG: PhoH family protein [Chlamydiota bacterium]